MDDSALPGLARGEDGTTLSAGGAPPLECSVGAALGAAARRRRGSARCAVHATGDPAVARGARVLQGEAADAAAGAAGGVLHYGAVDSDEFGTFYAGA